MCRRRAQDQLAGTALHGRADGIADAVHDGRAAEAFAVLLIRKKDFVPVGH
ncbi:MAG: hypothetical protein QM658_13490 [Gordonia sp. (in: high G+C Gram-positive bacteria)]